MLPAARVTDFHICPQVTVLVPHVGGPIIPPCCPTVITCSMPQARINDMATCIGPLDMIVTGSSTVLVGGLPAARITDRTVHGGMIATGCPTVLIGGGTARASGHGGSTTVWVDDATQTVHIHTNIEFSGPGATQAYADAAKKQIEDTWSGTMMHDGKPYNVVVEVDTKVNTSGTPTPGYDQVVVDPATTRMDQSLFGAGPGHQTPAAATDAGRPRRIAHEYGHTLGLDDGYVDTPTGSVPKDPSKKNDIMSETWPDSHGVLPHPHQDDYDQVLKNHGS